MSDGSRDILIEAVVREIVAALTQPDGILDRDHRLLERVVTLLEGLTDRVERLELERLAAIPPPSAPH